MRDACPGVLRLHAAADGHLARVRLPGGRLDARALDALADAAACGNDIVELTSRAGLQVRGLPEDGAAALASILSAGGLLPSLTHERVRNILAAPLAGRSPAALARVDGIVDALDRELCADAALAELPGRFLFAVDDGTRALESLRADVELAAEGDGLRLYLDGLATSLVAVPARAPDAALRAAHAFLALQGGDAGRAWRVRELEGGARRLARELGLEVLDGADILGGSERPSGTGAGDARRLGVSLQRDGLCAVAVLPPLARLGHAQLLRLAELARGLGAGVRVSPWRTLTFVDVLPSAAATLLDDLREIGLIVSNESGWTGLSACAGLGACARARMDVRAAAARRALVRDETSPTEHWSGCERRCGESPDAGIRVVGCEHGPEVQGGEERVVAQAVAAAAVPA
jgi:sulfite reductase beta subunit-like hemoprotein